MPDPALLERISINPAICGGKPCVRGHCIWVSLVLGMLAEGMSVEEILAEYPGLEEADVLAPASPTGRSSPAPATSSRPQ